MFHSSVERQHMSGIPDIAIMRDVLSGQIKLENIPLLPTRSERVSAAVAYIFLHGKQYLVGERFVVQPYGKLLRTLTGETCAEDYLSSMSGRLGLHKHVSAKDTCAHRVFLGEVGEHLFS